MSNFIAGIGTGILTVCVACAVALAITHYLDTKKYRSKR